MKIKVIGKNDGYAADCPMSALAVRDVLDRVRCEPGQSEIWYEFLDSPQHTGLPAELSGRQFRGDIYLLNVFAQRFEDMDEVHRAMLAAVVQTHEPADLHDLIRMTYGLDSIPVIPAEDYAEVGEICIDEEMLPLIEQCPDELLPLLDREKVGQRMAEESGGVIVNGFYCEVGEYEVPDIQFEINVPQDVFFRLRIGPDTPDGALRSQWISLPCSTDALDLFSVDGAPVKSLCCYEYESALPQLTWNMTGGMEQIYALNALAHHLSCLCHEDFVKCKAVMQAERIYTLEGTQELAQHLDEYDHDPAVSDSDDYAEKYLSQSLPENFDTTVLQEAELFDLGDALLGRKHGELTSYGAICHGELYSTITPQQEQTESLEEEMGGISQ